MRVAPSLLSATLLSTSITVAQAQVAPDAGQSIRDIEQTPLQLPPRQTLELNLPDAPSSEVKAGGPSLQVNGFTLQGNSVIASDELLPLLADLQGRTVSLGELQAGANRITLLYRERGYPLARAYLPAQEIDGGIVRIAVLEGRYGEVRLDNQSRLKGAALAPLGALQAGDAVRSAPLERSLLLLQDTPGVEVKSTLKPGASVGATDLLVDVQPGPLVSGSVDADNYGNRFTGEYRLGGTLNLNSPLGLGDRLSLRAMGSDEDQHYYRAAYQLPIGPWATQVGVAYSDMDYQLAKDFGDLDAHGNARIASVYAIQPLIRSRDFSLFAQLQFDDKRLKDDIDLFASKSDKRSRVVTAALNGNARDSLLGGGLSSFALAWSQGSLNIDGELEQLIDDLSAGTRGRFHKLNPSLVRLQRLSDRFSLYAQVQGQWSDANLDSSEKLSLGGAYGVRAYPQGEASGDQGWLANLELRYALTPAWQLNTFVDHGQVRLNKDSWSNGDNHRSLSAAGVGATWADHGWRINAVAAWKLGNDDPQSDVDRSPRVWAQVVRYF
ncbi:polypeptide-transport-associated domain-containing protein ShlB-type [Pseudomonas sp. BAY1663]|uniref:ShlB/FhaC/HecB family hemolysin secretion/activation protein n=1 Tax=Stutzerimonas stutzeri TaxID=316 RepID=A0A2N8T4D3_STUST|nr:MULTISPECIES: ShlB/FhaC/HecB family hemolysin secretion/activation protein [Pseudomonadaceae]EXF43195.1 polypeptide-transport-associated domain-containing protein ShlB-type [Pseudomonas sp. BAY1663]MCQ4324132.1 ShlB/FhaC/HecB family hemolysin secretion/activation protein [Stutzerimonas stutzeri]PNG09598.1 ShlB/FhaC/HecB family hemolysin secretion/activation protein [Stutzerimonas stutzeri]